MSANKNIIKPGDGKMIVMVNKPLDIVLGSYWLTKDMPGVKGEGGYYANPNSAILAYDYDALDLRAKIHVMPMKDKGEVRGVRRQDLRDDRRPPPLQHRPPERLPVR